MKKTFTSILTSALLIGNFATISLADEVPKGKPTTSSSLTDESPFGTRLNQPITQPKQETAMERLTAKHETLSERLFSTEYPTLPLSEQISLLKESFSLKKQLHNEYLRLLMSSTSMTDTERIHQFMLTQQETINNELALLDQVIGLADSKQTKELQGMKEEIKSTIEMLQELRMTGRNLKEAVTIKEQTLQASQISILQQVVTTSIKEKEINKAIEALTKMVKLSQGDQDYVKFLKELLPKNQFYILWKHELFATNLKEEDKTHYISTNELSRWFKTTVAIEQNGEETITIQEGTRSVKFTTNGVYLNGVYIGVASWHKDETNQYYIDVEFILKAMSYELSMEHGENILSITKAVYPMEEVDLLPAETIIQSLLDTVK